MGRPGPAPGAIVQKAEGLGWSLSPRALDPLLSTKDSSLQRPNSPRVALGHRGFAGAQTFQAPGWRCKGVFWVSSVRLSLSTVVPVPFPPLEYTMDLTLCLRHERQFRTEGQDRGFHGALPTLGWGGVSADPISGGADGICLAPSVGVQWHFYGIIQSGIKKRN